MRPDPWVPVRITLPACPECAIRRNLCPHNQSVRAAGLRCPARRLTPAGATSFRVLRHGDAASGPGAGALRWGVLGVGRVFPWRGGLAFARADHPRAVPRFQLPVRSSLSGLSGCTARRPESTVRVRGQT